MAFAVIDCGTTNSRLYLLDEDRRMLAQGTRKIGVRDTAITGSKAALRQGLASLLRETLAQANLSLDQLRFAITAGMITSELGLVEVPHRPAPVGLAELAAHIQVLNDAALFPCPLLLIPGVKNAFPAAASTRDIRKIDFMRGEETQVAGLLATQPALTRPLVLVILSSHTKYVYVDVQDRITGSLTNLSGQVYAAITKETSIGKSLHPDGPAPADYFDTTVIESAREAVTQCGFLRALIMPRFLEVLLARPWYERALFLNTAIATEDLKVMADFPLVGFRQDAANYVLVGNTVRCRLLAYLMQQSGIPADRVHQCTDKAKIDQLSIQGALAIAWKSGYLQR